MGAGSFPGVDHPPPSSAEVKERVELYLYCTSGPSWPVRGWTLTLPLPLPLCCLSGRTVSQAVSRRPHIVDAWVLCQVRACEFCVAQRSTGRGFCPSISISASNIIPPMSRTYLRLHVTVTRTPEVQSPWTFKESALFSKIRYHWIGKYFNFLCFICHIPSCTFSWWRLTVQRVLINS